MIRLYKLIFGLGESFGSNRVSLTKSTKVARFRKTYYIWKMVTKMGLDDLISNLDQKLILESFPNENRHLKTLGLNFEQTLSVA